GAFAHSLTALLPIASVWTMAGLEIGAARFARWRRLSARQAQRNLSLIGVAGALVASIGLGVRFLDEWRGWVDLHRRAAAIIADAAPGAVVVTADPGSYSAIARTPALAMPNLPLSEALAVTQRYNAQILLVGPARPVSWTEFADEADPPGLTLLGRVGEWRVYRLASSSAFRGRYMGRLISMTSG
ncbi:MAG: hypothetical protein NZ518_01670, partial [Dehalococcoidia bacterium]|nr:hypothetical protein [Dehalococcoidia bacterium]